MRLARVLVVLAFGGPVLAMMASGQGPDSPETCSQSLMRHQVTATPANGRTFTIDITQAGGGCLGAPNLIDIQAGSSYVVRCGFTESAVAPPAPTVTLYAYHAGESFANPGSGTGLIWSQAMPTCDGIDPASSITRACTVDGTVGGSARNGLVRIVVRATGGVGATAYDINSDPNNGLTVGGPGAGTGNEVVNTQPGYVRCDPVITTYTDGNPSSSPSVYIGGDTYRSSFAVNSAPYTNPTDAWVTPEVECGASTNTGAAIRPTTTATTTDFSIKGGPSISSTPWADGCTLTQEYVVTKTVNIAQPGDAEETVPIIIWTITSPPSGVTFPDDTHARRVTKALDRDLTAQASSHRIGNLPASTFTRTLYNRGEMFSQFGTWVDARSANPPTGRLATSYVNRVGTTLRDETDTPKTTNRTFSASGLFAAVHVWDTDATVTHPTPGNRQYRTCIETYGASRTDAELFNSGCTHSAASALSDVSSTWTFAEASTSKESDLDPIARTFIIGPDTMWARCENLLNARGEAMQGRSVTGTVTGGTSPEAQDMSPTDANGDSTTEVFAVNAPAGSRTFNCAATAVGNSASRDLAITFISPLTANRGVHVTANASGGPLSFTINVTAYPVTYDTACDCILTPMPDDVSRLTVKRYDPALSQYVNVVSRVAMSPVNSVVRFGEVTIPSSYLQWPVSVFVTSNVSATPFFGDAYVANTTDLVISTFPADAPHPADDLSEDDVSLVSGMTAFFTELEPYAPFFIWGFLLIFFITRDAWFPAFTAFLACLSSLKDPPIIPVLGMISLNLLAIVLHVLATRTNAFKRKTPTR